MMEKIIQRKVIGNNVRQWEIDLKAVQANIAWTAKNSSLLEKELKEMNEHFPFFYLSLASAHNLSSLDSFCPQCGELIAFYEGIHCLGCGATITPYRDSLLAYIGQIPSLIGSLSANGQLGNKDTKFLNGRPFLKMIHSLLQKDNASENTAIKKLFLAKSNSDRTDIYFSPLIYAYFPDNWPRGGPMIFVPKNYFEVLFHNSGYSQSDFHAYNESASDMYKLCLYSNWHTLTMRIVLQQRIVPKIIIDLMIADLMAIGKLNQVLNSLGTDTHQLYNWIGKGDKSEKFKKQYDKYIKI